MPAEPVVASSRSSTFHPHRARIPVLALLPLLGLLATACAGDHGEDPVHREAEFCTDEAGLTHRIDFDGVSELLADDDELAAAVGIDVVESCEDALRTLDTRNELAERAAPSDGPMPERIAAAPEIDFRIRDGFSNGHPGAVEQRILGDGHVCSGILISPVAIVTAAHCLDNLLSPSDTDDGVAFDTMRANYRRSNAWLAAHPGATTWTCITGPDDPNADGKCYSTSTDAVAVVMHGPYVGGVDTPSDIGVIVKLSGEWEGVSDGDFVRVWQDTFTPFDRFEGWGRGYNAYAGTGSGVMRTAGFGLDWYGTHYFYSIARTPRLCKGDSGGPAIFDDAGNFPYALGLWSNFEHSPNSDNCAMHDGKQRLVRLNTKIDWIEDWIVEFRGASWGCASYIDSNLGNNTYRKCW